MADFRFSPPIGPLSGISFENQIAQVLSYILVEIGDVNADLGELETLVQQALAIANNALEQSTTNATKITEIIDDLVIIQQDITQLKADVIAAQTRADDAYDLAASNETDVTSIQGTIADILERLSSVEQIAQEAFDTANTASAQIADLVKEVNGLWLYIDDTDTYPDLNAVFDDGINLFISNTDVAGLPVQKQGWFTNRTDDDILKAFQTFTSFDGSDFFVRSGNISEDGLSVTWGAWVNIASRLASNDFAGSVKGSADTPYKISVDPITGEMTLNTGGKVLSENDLTDSLKAVYDGYNERIQALDGALVYIGTIHLDTADVTQEALTARAAELGYTTLYSGLTLIDNQQMDWLYNGTEWINIGGGTVSIATNASPGIVQGDSSAQYYVSVGADGKMQVNTGGQQLSDLNFTSTLKTNYDLASSNASTAITQITAHTAQVSGPHGATSSATPERIIQRDTSGRAQVAAPSDAADIARKDTVDAMGAAKITRTGDTMSGKLVIEKTSSEPMSTNGSLDFLDITQAGDGAAGITFHRRGKFAVNLGLDIDNKLKWGGWSKGAAKRILDEDDIGAILTATTYQNGTTGYILFSNGFKVQWGIASFAAAGQAYQAVFSFPIAFNSTSFSIVATKTGAGSTDATSHISILSTGTTACGLGATGAGTAQVIAAGY